VAKKSFCDICGSESVVTVGGRLDSTCPHLQLGGKVFYVGASFHEQEKGVIDYPDLCGSCVLRLLQALIIRK